MRRTPPPGPDFPSPARLCGSGAAKSAGPRRIRRSNSMAGAIEETVDLGQGHRPCRRQCEFAHDPGPARRHRDRRALHPQGDLADGRTAPPPRCRIGCAPNGSAPACRCRKAIWPAASPTPRRANISPPAGCGTARRARPWPRWRGGARRDGLRTERALFLDRRRQSAQRRAVGRPAREMDSRPRPDQCLARAAGAGRRADSRARGARRRAARQSKAAGADGAADSWRRAMSAMSSGSRSAGSRPRASRPCGWAAARMRRKSTRIISRRRRRVCGPNWRARRSGRRRELFIPVAPTRFPPRRPRAC